MASHSGQTLWFGPGGITTLASFMVANALLGLTCGLVPSVAQTLPMAPLLLAILGLAFGGCLGVLIVWRRQRQPAVVTPVIAPATDPMPTSPSQYAVEARPASAEPVRLSARAQEMQRRARAGSGVTHAVGPMAPAPSAPAAPQQPSQQAFASPGSLGSQSLQIDDLWQRQASAIERNLSGQSQPRLDRHVVDAAIAQHHAPPAQHQESTWITGPEPGTLHDASALIDDGQDTMHDFRAVVRDSAPSTGSHLSPAATSGSWTDELWQDDDLDDWLRGGGQANTHRSGTVPEQPAMAAHRSRSRPPTDPGTLHEVGAMTQPRRARSLDLIDATPPLVPDD